jgi:RNA polymerase sigma factor (sigma-70 family)
VIQDDERELVERCVDNDRAAWNELVTRYSALVYASIHRTLRARGVRIDADDVAELHNSIFLALYENDCRRLRQFGGRCRLTSWIKVVSVNYTIDKLRQRFRVRWLSIDDTDDDGYNPFAERLVAEDPDPEHRASSREETLALAQVIDELTDADRQLLERLFLEDVPFQDIADELGTSLGAVYTRKNRLVARLKAGQDKQLSRKKVLRSSSSRAKSRRRKRRGEE